MATSALRGCFIAAALASAVCAGAACSGKTMVDAGAGGASHADAGSGGDAGTTTGTMPPDCPATDPQQGGACSRDGLLCEYGDDFNPLCNAVRVCSSGRWASPVYYGGSSKCPTEAPTFPPNEPGCAATRAGVPVAQACSSSLSCEYDGSSCFCGVFCPSYPISQPDCDADAGVTQNCCDKSAVEWHCFDGPAYCPLPRPKVGTACAKAGDTCAVEVPGECGQTLLACENGVWNVRNDSCPISSARAKEAITYVGAADSEHLRDELMAVRLATYRYAHGDGARHLGFVIEDMPLTSPAVQPARDRVDLYGYVSMAVASLQQHEREIAALRADVARLGAENAALRGRSRPAKP